MYIYIYLFIFMRVCVTCFYVYIRINLNFALLIKCSWSPNAAITHGNASHYLLMGT